MFGGGTESSMSAKPKWGDEEENDDYILNEVTTDSEDPDGSIHKTIVEYKLNEKKQKVKVIKRIKISKKNVKISKAVEERKKWKKFGECANALAGPERGITTVGDEVFLELVKGQKSADKRKESGVPPVDIVCRNCGKTGDHWTMKCPYKHKIPAPGMPTDLAALTGGSGGPGTYKIPQMRGQGATTGSSEASDRAARHRDEIATIRVTNLSEDTKESDLSELFRKFGPITRIYLAKDKVTGLSKGFAFVNFVYREDAAKAIDKLDGFGYDHLILHLEWSNK